MKIKPLFLGKTCFKDGIHEGTPGHFFTEVSFCIFLFNAKNHMSIRLKIKKVTLGGPFFLERRVFL